MNVFFIVCTVTTGHKCRLLNFQNFCEKFDRRSYVEVFTTLNWCVVCIFLQIVFLIVGVKFLHGQTTMYNLHLNMINAFYEPKRRIKAWDERIYLILLSYDVLIHEKETQYSQ